MYHFQHVFSSCLPRRTNNFVFCTFPANRIWWWHSTKTHVGVRACREYMSGVPEALTPCAIFPPLCSSVQTAGLVPDRFSSLCPSPPGCFFVAPRGNSETKSEPWRANYVHLNEAIPWDCSAQRWERVQMERSWSGKLTGHVWVCECGRERTRDTHTHTRYSLE